MSMPRVALVGRPNVGKSTLFNRLIGKRQAVVADIAGTTRDRLERPLHWQGRDFDVVDMAGLEPALEEKTEIRQGMQAQVQRGLADADLIIWVVDAIDGATAADTVIAELLRRLGKPVVVAVNKVDHTNRDDALFDFLRFGFIESVPVSAIHGRGIAELLNAVTQYLPEDTASAPVPVYSEKELRLAIVGRPNVGKSTLLNALVGDTRSVVSAEAGTTRDAVDTVLPVKVLYPNVFTPWNTVRIIDTAGIRRRGKIDRQIEGWSVIRSFDTIDEAEVVLLVLDATEKMVHQDLQVAERVVEAGRALVLLINKWDAILAAKGVEVGSEEDQAEQERFLNIMRAKAPFLHWVQVLFISAAEQMNTQVISRLVLNAYTAWNRSIRQEDLDELTAHLKTNPRLRDLKRITYEHARPPVFHLHVKGKAIPHFSTRRYVENALRDFFELGSTPIKIWVQAAKRAKQKEQD